MTRAYVLDPVTRATLGLVDQSWERLAYTRRYVAMDTFELVINRTRLWASELAKNCLLYLPDEGDLVFLIEQIASVAEGSTRNDEMTVTGRSLEGIAMAERLVEPPPGESHDRQTSVPAETAIKHYVRAQAADLADLARQVPGLVVAPDAARGPAVTINGRYQSVLDLVREIGLLAGLGWEITYDPGSSDFVFDVADGVDRSASVFFDFAFETLERWEELDSVIDAKTVALVAGQGEGVDRDLVTRWSGTEPTGFERREAFLDARDVELGETTVLAQRGDAFLAATGAETSLEADVHQYGGFRYREHWDVGDIVTVRNAERGLAYAARIVEVEKAFARSAAAPTITATLGRPFPTLASKTSTGRAAATADGAVSAASGGLPVGSIVLWPAVGPPTDWLTCDGGSLLRSAYPSLFDVIGTTYGAADGTHFSVPDYRGRVPVGLKSGDADFDTLGETSGAKTATPSAHAVTQPAAHAVTQPAAHANHVVTQPAAHAALTHGVHAGTDVSTHAGAAVAAHSTHSHELPFIIDDTHAISSLDQGTFGGGHSTDAQLDLERGVGVGVVRRGQVPGGRRLRAHGDAALRPHRHPAGGARRPRRPEPHGRRGRRALGAHRHGRVGPHRVCRRRPRGDVRRPAEPRRQLHHQGSLKERPMAQRSRFFDSSGGDRIYTSDAWAQVLGAIIGDGVVASGNELAVAEASPPAMSVRVNTGKAFIGGYYFEVHTGQETLAIAAAHPTLGRIDRVVVRRDLAGRTATLAVLAGTPADTPSAPALTQVAAGVWEISLASVAVAPAAASIVDANITDERGPRAKGTDIEDLSTELLDPSTGHRHEGTAGTGRVVRHADLGGLTSDNHHAKAHTHSGDGSGSVAHAATTGQTATDHHAAPVAGPDANVTVDASGAAGTAGAFARSAHGHQVATSGAAPADVAAAGAAGATGALSRAAHVHAHGSGYLPDAHHPQVHALGSHTGIADDINAWAQASAGGGAAGVKLWVGTTDPGGSAVEGDIWVKQ